MKFTYKQLQLNQLNIPAETLRKSSFPANDKKLKKSIKEHGVFVPVIVTELGKGEYAVWDGTRRTRCIKEMGMPGNYKIPALVTNGDDVQAVISQININQYRENLSSFSEAEAVRQLVKDYGMKQTEAGKVLLKSKSWVTRVLKVWNLPKEILDDFKSGKIILSQAFILSEYTENKNILNMLYKEAVKGLSREDLKALAIRAENAGIQKAGKYKPKTTSFGKKSWIQLKPLQKAVSISVHIEDSDDPQKAIEKFSNMIESLKQ